MAEQYVTLRFSAESVAALEKTLRAVGRMLRVLDEETAGIEAWADAFHAALEASRD